MFMEEMSMSRNANIHIRTDSQTKAGAEQLFSTFGITISDAINIFLRQSILVGGLPFEVRQPRYNPETESAIQEARDIMEGKTKSRIFSTVAEMNTNIDGDDN
jgi:DNA-damage-inducible protein J